MPASVRPFPPRARQGRSRVVSPVTALGRARVTDERAVRSLAGMQPTIVLVHGAFAESSSWNGVIEPLIGAGHRVIAVANPLRGIAADAAAVTDVVREIEGPIVLVGHSYGGSVISNVDPDAAGIVALVYVCAFAPAPGETCFGLSTLYSGSTLGDTLESWPRTDGTTDLTIARDRFREQFCADVPAPEAALMAATQRPVTQEALVEPSGERPLWKALPSSFAIGELDRNIPAKAQRYMAERAGAGRILEIPGASHAAAVSRPDVIAGLVLAAAAQVAVA